MEEFLKNSKLQVHSLKVRVPEIFTSFLQPVIVRIWLGPETKFSTSKHFLYKGVLSIHSPTNCSDLT